MLTSVLRTLFKKYTNKNWEMLICALKAQVKKSKIEKFCWKLCIQYSKNLVKSYLFKT